MIKLLVVDDSPLMRRLLAEIFEADGGFAVSVARDGVEALEALHREQPDVITLDVQMPRMDGLTCLDRIMVERPTPVVMVSNLTHQGAQQSIQALQLGAVDVIAKPTGAVSLKIGELAATLVETVRGAAGARLSRARRLTERLRAREGRVAPSEPRATKAYRKRRLEAVQGDGLVLVGASTGGPPALDALLRPLPAGFPWPIVIAQHMPATFTAALAQRLNELTALTVQEVTRPTPLTPGTVLVGRGDADVVISRRPEGLVAMASPADPSRRWHPSVDRLVETALDFLAPSQIVGVLMTGMGNDGAGPMTQLRQAGGRTIAEAEETAVVWGMPGELVRRGGAEMVARLEEIAERLMDLAGVR